MNFNSKNDYELYDLNNNSTEHASLLVNKNIDNFFLDLLNKSEPKINKITIKSQNTLNKFYQDYIEHNLLFFILLIGIIIFLIIRYFSKESENMNQLHDYKENNYKENSKKIKQKNRTIKSNDLIKYKKELDNEKKKILQIIDELSNLNNISEIDNNYKNNINYIENNNELENANNYIQKNFINIPQIKDNDEQNYDNNSVFYNFNKINDEKKDNLINGMYIEPPFY